MFVKIFIPILLSFAITAVLGPILIPFLRKLKVGQTEREELESHQVKTGTPTMGGIMILIAVSVTSVIFLRDYPRIIPILFLTVGFGIIGFLDDYLKVVLRRPDGLLAWQKMLLQIVVTSIFAYYLLHYTDVSLAMLIPFSGGKYLDLGWLAVPFLYIVVIGTVNGVNFTDGLDGLASSVTVLVAVFFTVVAVGMNSGIEPITCAVVGALMGFLLFNVYPASVFMGDTGSLALGGFVAATAFVLKMPIFIVIVGFVYLWESITVMLQVGWFKITKRKYGEGRRLFKMAPFHHHLEQCGWRETKVVTLFYVVTALLCLLGFLGSKAMF